jgi:roadblock/LC7 domain-containing protein
MDNEKVVAAYVKLRDMKAQMAAKFKAEVAKVDEAIQKLDARLLAQLSAANAESIRTQAGTFFKTVKTSATVADWDALLGYIIANDAYHMLDKRVNKTSVAEFKEEKNDLPPGVNWREENTIGVRRS